ncbi:helix-turn-helix domain-containing protein [Clostridium sp. JNZ J1-5]
MVLKENLVHLRKSNNLSQEKVAELVGVSRQAVSKWETGLSKPDTENLMKLAEIFHVSMDELTKMNSAHIESIERTGENENITRKNAEVEFHMSKRVAFYLYVFGALIGFLGFAFGITYAESNSIWIIVGIVGMILIWYCSSKIINSIMK